MARPLQFGSTAPARVKALAAAIGQRLRIARKRRRLTQAELGARAGINRLTVRKVEAGEVQTAIGAYVAMTWALGLDKQLDELFASDPEGEALERARLPQRVREGSTDKDEF
jgi:transcriptional regulator with XRE-family HTH domain